MDSRKSRKYDGQWVALDGDTLLASGTDGKKVHAEAQAKGIKVPFMHRVSIKETEPFGGWYKWQKLTCLMGIM